MPDDASTIASDTVSENSSQAILLARIAAAIAGLDEKSVKREMESVQGRVAPVLVEEVILQSYLFAGFPRALNAARIWRGFVPASAAASVAPDGVEVWRGQGEKTCAAVYGEAYGKLRSNIRALHPLLDEWMIVDGYGKVLSRPGLDLKLRELCIVAACAASGQQRQLHSHLHGALNAGVKPEIVEATLEALTGMVPADRLASYKRLFNHVKRGATVVH